MLRTKTLRIWTITDKQFKFTIALKQSIFDDYFKHHIVDHRLYFSA